MNVFVHWGSLLAQAVDLKYSNSSLLLASPFSRSSDFLRIHFLRVYMTKCCSVIIMQIVDPNNQFVIMYNVQMYMRRNNNAQDEITKQLMKQICMHMPKYKITVDIHVHDMPRNSRIANCTSTHAYAEITKEHAMELNLAFQFYFYLPETTDQRCSHLLSRTAVQDSRGCWQFDP